MVREMTFDDACGWRAYYELEPFGEWRDDLRIGYAFAQMAASLGAESPRPKDFMPPDLADVRSRTQTKPSYQQVRSAFFATVKRLTPEEEAALKEDSSE